MIVHKLWMIIRWTTLMIIVHTWIKFNIIGLFLFRMKTLILYTHLKGLYQTTLCVDNELNSRPMSICQCKSLFKNSEAAVRTKLQPFFSRRPTTIHLVGDERTSAMNDVPMWLDMYVQWKLCSSVFMYVCLCVCVSVCVNYPILILIQYTYRCANRT